MSKPGFRRHPGPAASQQAAGFGNYVQLAVRQELHEGFQEIAIGLRNRVDPRPALAELCRRLVDRGAQRESAQARFIAACADDYNRLLNRLSEGLSKQFPDGYPDAPPPRFPVHGPRLIPDGRPAAAGRPDPVEAAVRKGLVPPSIDAAAVAARWRERAWRDLPVLAASPADTSLEDGLIRDHFHDAVVAGVKRLEMGLDPREALALHHLQIVGLSASEDVAECRALARMVAEYGKLVRHARRAGPHSS